MPESLIRFSLVKHALDNHPTAHASTWDALCRALDVDRNPASPPAGSDAKKYLPGILGATFTRSIRACADVDRKQLVLIDFDNTESIPDPSGALHPSGRPVMVKRRIGHPAGMGAVCDELERLGLAAYAYSTWSSTPEEPRFRLVLPLEVPVLQDYWPNLLAWVLGVSGLLKWRDGMDMPCSLDVARLNFLPARRPGGLPVERRKVPGEILEPPSVDKLPLCGVPEVELQPWQVAATEKREASCPVTTPGKCAWARRFKSSDGKPLDLRTLDGVRLLESLGCRVGPGKPAGAGVKHRTSRPWPGEHTHGLDDDSAVLFLESGRWPAWHCSHAHHAHLGLVDLLEAAGVLHAA